MQVGLSDTELSVIANDSERFVLRFFEAMKASAIHVYHSALTWCPTISLVRTLYRNHIPTNVTMLHSIDNSWDARTRVIQAEREVDDVACSHKDDSVVVMEGRCMKVFGVVTGQHRLGGMEIGSCLQHSQLTTRTSWLDVIAV